MADLQVDARRQRDAGERAVRVDRRALRQDLQPEESRIVGDRQREVGDAGHSGRRRGNWTSRGATLGHNAATSRTPMSNLPRLTVPLCLLSLLAAQHEPPDPFGHSRHGSAFDEGPRQAAYRMPGMSTQVHMEVAGLCDEAQAFFDQGLCQLHGFWYFEAERSFRQVAKLQPECAMAYWGMAMANVENVARAVGFLANAVRRSAAVPRYEQLWIDGWAKYYAIDDKAREELRSGDEARIEKAIEGLVAALESRDKPARTKAHDQLLKDLGTIVFEFPDDIEAKALLAVQIWDLEEWGSKVRSHTAVDALLAQVFAKAPQHPAHHYRVHLWDGEAGERALKSAAAIGDSAPGIAHQWHMAGHIYAKLHRHKEAAWQQEASGRVDHAHLQRDRVMPFEIHNYGHNQEWLARSLSHQGRVEEALAVAKNLAELPRHPKKSRLAEGGDIAFYARERLASVCEEHELWQAALQLDRDGYFDAADAVMPEIVRLSLLGRAAYRLGRLDEGDRFAAAAKELLPRARAERAKAIDTAEDEALAKGRERKQVDEALASAQRRATDMVRAVRDLERELAAERLLATGDAKAAVEAFAKLEGFPKTLLADAHVAAGEPEKAIEILGKEVEKNPKRAATTLRLVAACTASGKEEHLAKAKDLMADALPAFDLAGLAASALWRRAGVGVAAPLAGGAADAPAGFGDDFGPRPPLASLGPAHWSPQPAPGFDLEQAGGGRRSLARQAGKPTLVVFYLGFGCLHCVEQLRALAPMADDYAAAGIDVVAIGTDPAGKAAESLAAMDEAERFPFPLLADPELAAFRAWRCHDDFESMPLHGTFLVDGAGLVRWQDISFEPFTELAWLLGESRRLLALPAAAGAGAK